MAYNPLAARTFKASPTGGLPIVVRMAPGDVEILALDLSECMLDADTISGTPGWAASPAGIVTLGGEALIGTTVSAVLVTAGSSEGTTLITCSATITANSRVYKRSITVQVRSPLS